MIMKNRYYMIPSLAALTSCLLLGTACQADAEKTAPAKAPAAPVAVQKSACTIKLSAQTSFRKTANAQQKAIMGKQLTPEQAKAMRAFDEKINTVNRNLIWKKMFNEADAELKKLLAEKDQEQALRSKIVLLMADNVSRKNDPALLVKEVDTLLKQYANVLTPADKAALYRYQAGAFDKQKKYCEKTKVLYARLGCAITEQDAENTCNELIQAVWNAGKQAEAVALAKEFADMAGADKKSARISKLLYYARMMKDAAVCKDALAAYKKAEKDINKVANETIQVASAFRSKSMDFIPALQEIIANPAYAFRLRANALAEYMNSGAAKKKPAEIIDLANKHLFTVKDIPPADYTYLVYNVLLNHAARTMGRHDLAQQYCKSLLAYPQVQTAPKVDAVKRLTTYMAQRGEYAEAFKLIDQGFTFDKLAVTQYVDLCRQYVNLLKWQGKCDEAVKYLRSKINDANKKLILKEVAVIYTYFRELDKAYAAYMEAGMPVEAVGVYGGIEPAKAQTLALKIIEDEKNYTEQVRGALLVHFLGSGKKNADIRKKYAPLLKYVNGWSLPGTMRYAATAKDYDRTFEMMEIMKQRNSFVLDNTTAQILLEYYINSGNVAKLKELKEQLPASRVSAANKVRFDIAIDLFTAIRQDKAGAFKAFYKNSKFPAMTQKERADLLLSLSALALNAKFFTVCEEIYDTYLSLYKPQPCKTYNVPFSDKPVLGVHGFLSLEKMPAPQFMDRKYGGNMDFLVTDVSTGDRGGAISGKQSGDTYKPSELRMICDKYGLHMMFKAFDSKAKDIEAGIVSAGSFEMYFAPGDNQPYYCPLPDMSNTAVGIWNSSYDHRQWRQLDQFGKTNFDIKTEKVYTEDGYIVYMFVAWDKFYDKLPEKGDTWDFENVHWSRFGGNSWNGLKTIHGRSTWGKLAFDISDDQMRQIKRNLIIKARQAYLKEKRTSGKYHGVIDRWANDKYVGDSAFYNEKVAPLIQKLDSYLPLVTANMNDETVDTLFFEAVPAWNEIRYTIEDLRREYLEEKLSK